MSDQRLLKLWSYFGIRVPEGGDLDIKDARTTLQLMDSLLNSDCTIEIVDEATNQERETNQQKISIRVGCSSNRNIKRRAADGSGDSLGEALLDAADHFYFG